MAQRKKPLVKPGVKRDSIVTFLDDFLNTASIKDYSCNGIQVQGASQIKKLALAVDASMEAYRRTAELGCEMLLVHHGIIWDGLKYQRPMNISNSSGQRHQSLCLSSPSIFIRLWVIMPKL